MPECCFEFVFGTDILRAVPDHRRPQYSGYIKRQSEAQATWPPGSVTQATFCFEARSVDPVDSVQVQLTYGDSKSFTCEVPGYRVLGMNRPPAADPDFREKLRDQLRRPIESPPLSQFVVESDRVVLALDPSTPAASEVVAEIWEELKSRDVDASNVLILQPQVNPSHRTVDPREQLDEETRESMQWKIHDPDQEDSCAYLASTGTGERVYLAKELIEAELVITVGVSGFDALLGYRGTSSILFPGLSDAEAQKKTAGQGHSELSPDNERPLRQLVDEIAWLLGTMITVQVVPSIGGGVAGTLVGSLEKITRESRKLHSRHWKITLPSRADLVVVAIEVDESGHGWNQLGAALETARSVVCGDGRIVVLSQIAGELGTGLEIVRSSFEPSEAMKPLRMEMPPDVIAATELAQATDWARVYLLSDLDPEVVEELFAVPLEDPAEAVRLIETEDTCVFIQSAHNVHAEIED